MWRSAKGVCPSRLTRDGWAAGLSVTRGGSRGVGARSPPPLSPPVDGGRRVLQSCLVRAVLVPERFRGGIAPSALVSRLSRTGSPAGNDWANLPSPDQTARVV